MHNRFGWPIYSGRFTLTFDGQTTAPIVYNAPSSVVES